MIRIMIDDSIEPINDKLSQYPSISITNTHNIIIIDRKTLNTRNPPFGHCTIRLAVRYILLKCQSHRDMHVATN